MTGLRIAHLFPRTLGMNGESGNVDILRFRAESRGLTVVVDRIEHGDVISPETDLVFVGSGPVSALIETEPWIDDVSPALHTLAAADVPFLAVGGGFQLLGEWVRLADGRELEGAGVFPVTTTVAGERVVGDFVIESRLGVLVGFENRGSYIDIGSAAPIGHVIYGRGNVAATGPGASAGAAAVAASGANVAGTLLVAPDQRVEGYWVGNLIGTHLHGPVLANNPALADWLLAAALARREETLPEATAELDEIDRRASEARSTIAAAPLSE
ncbi:glutamine amidotransferase [Subtercola frigoramans]|uniref:Lipid II isoglutaminyl synthase (glutamine-hydrolyzing) subunit GatD n=1 Tax=Subtercola frigoramans TaxID=120298 RepID=A0ABS2L4V2_9MICO|nr:glutamine amidotransferase [Subtercola frigoramans]MBM7472093.1 CobQ-like glutamine amidotransferase family enzyme [Subtercola frigoramans]